jgi:hypothetical protein
MARQTPSSPPPGSYQGTAVVCLPPLPDRTSPSLLLQQFCREVPVHLSRPLRHHGDVLKIRFPPLSTLSLPFCAHSVPAPYTLHPSSQPSPSIISSRPQPLKLTPLPTPLRDGGSRTICSSVFGGPLPSEQGTNSNVLRTASQGQNLALTVLYVPCSLDSGG